MNRPLAPARLLIAIVLFFNLQCAFAFLLWPQTYMPGFGLDGILGQQMVRALGVLFLMWNIPYLFALAHPVRHFISLLEAVLMQAIAVLGDALILLVAGPLPSQIQSTLQRFILFDGVGLLLLLIALVIARQLSSSISTKPE